MHPLCSPTTAMTVLYGVVLAAFAVYFVAAWCSFRRVIKALKARPYHEIREARHNLNYQVRWRSSDQGGSVEGLPVLDCQTRELSCQKLCPVPPYHSSTQATSGIQATRESCRGFPSMRADSLAAAQIFMDTLLSSFTLAAMPCGLYINYGSCASYLEVRDMPGQRA